VFQAERKDIPFDPQNLIRIMPAEGAYQRAETPPFAV
jgi:hypothetical protein